MTGRLILLVLAKANPDAGVYVCVGFGFVALIAFFVIRWVNAAPCPNCGRKFTGRWLRQRVDGGPDRRFTENYRICSNCGHQIDH